MFDWHSSFMSNITCRREGGQGEIATSILVASHLNCSTILGSKWSKNFWQVFIEGLFSDKQWFSHRCFIEAQHRRVAADLVHEWLQLMSTIVYTKLVLVMYKLTDNQKLTLSET